MTGWRRELGAVFRLAWPLAFVQLNATLTGAVDTALAGRVNAVTMGAVGLGSSVFLAMAILGLGLGMGCEPLIAQAFGAKKDRLARHEAWQGAYVALLAAVPLYLLALLFAANLEHLGVAADLAPPTRAFLYGRLPSLPPFFVGVVLRVYLQAAHHTRPVVWIAVAMNLVNFVLDWLFLFGDAGLGRLGLPPLGVPMLGAFGVGLASTLATFLQTALLAVAVGRMPMAADAAPWRRPVPRLMRRIVDIGLPTGLQMLAECGVFTLTALFMGGMGTTAMAAHQTAMMLASLSFSVCVGIGAATAVQVGRAIGRGDTAATRHSGFAGLNLGIGFMAASALCLWFFPAQLARLLTDDPALVDAAVPLLRIAGVFQIADGAQTVMSGALRGAGHTRWPFVTNVVSHWGIGLPIALALGFSMKLGPRGLWWGLTAGLIVAALVLSWQFFRLSARPIVALDV